MITFLFSSLGMLMLTTLDLAHHTSTPLVNTSSQHLHTLLQRYKLERLGPTFFTFFNNRSKTKPGVILRNSHAIHLNQFASLGPVLLSDHRHIILTISSSQILIPSATRCDYNNRTHTYLTYRTQRPTLWTNIG